MRVAVMLALLIGMSTGCAPAISDNPVAARPEPRPIPLARAAVLVDVYGQLLALLRPCPTLRARGLRFRRNVVSNAKIGRTADDARLIEIAMDRAFAREVPRWNIRVPPRVCARTGRLLEATQANENERVSAIAGIW